MISNKRLHFLYGLFLLFACSCQPQGQSESKHSDKDHRVTSDSTTVSFKNWLDGSQPLISAHRGGPYPGYPENAIETFQNIVDQIPAIIECDVSMTKDSILILMHDKTLDRTTTGEGQVVGFTLAELKMLELIDNQGDTTDFTIPTLHEVLLWGKGKTLFTLDVKRGVPYEMVIRAIETLEASSYAAIITYRIQDAIYVFEKNQELLISVSAGNDSALEQIKTSGIPSTNLLGFVGTREPEIEHYDKLASLGIISILGTLGNLDKSAQAKGDDSIYQTYIENGAKIIATDRPIEVAKALNVY